MNNPIKCYIKSCGLPPVFICKCEGNQYICQKHCFSHMGGSCTGKLFPYIDIESLSKLAQAETCSKFSRLEPSDLLSSLFPSEERISQCNRCGKLIPQDQETSHSCSRFTISAMNIDFTRVGISLYTCSLCHKQVHSSFIFPHADYHQLVNTSSGTSLTDIHLLASLILRNSAFLNESAQLNGKSRGKPPLVSPSFLKTSLTEGSEITILPIKRTREEVNICNTVNVDNV